MLMIIMEIEKHHKQFKEIISKYNLEEKAEHIAHEVAGKTINVSEFAKKHEMQIKEAQLFLSFLQKGIDFKMRCMK